MFANWHPSHLQWNVVLTHRKLDASVDTGIVNDLGGDGIP